MNVEQIIREEKLIMLAATGKHEEVIGVLKKYPEQRGEILAKMLVQALTMTPGSQSELSNVQTARQEMLIKVNEIISVISAFNDAFEALGVSPMINYKRSYSTVSADVNETMVAEDMKAGLDLYNACAKYCVIYNANSGDSDG